MTAECLEDALGAGLFTKGRYGKPRTRSVCDRHVGNHDAQGSGAPAKDVERLRCQAESLLSVVSEYQRCAVGGPPSTTQ